MIAISNMTHSASVHQEQVPRKTKPVAGGWAGRENQEKISEKTGRNRTMIKA